MANGYTVFTSYILVPNNGYSKSIHCNYIKSLFLDANNPYIQEISLSFPNISDFKFLSNSLSGGTGYTANKIKALVQIVNNSGFTTAAEAKPIASNWRVYDLTPQIITNVSGSTLTPLELTQQVFKIPLLNYLTFPTYNISDIITYPSKETSADGDLCFGDEVFFLGNVITDIKAIAYTTDISIILPLNEFNSSTNETWNEDKVAITEIGIYDSNKNLVAIGKLNNPIEKDSTISRTIVFALDF